MKNIEAAIENENAAIKQNEQQIYDLGHGIYIRGETPEGKSRHDDHVDFLKHDTAHRRMVIASLEKRDGFNP